MPQKMKFDLPADYEGYGYSAPEKFNWRCLFGHRFGEWFISLSAEAEKVRQCHRCGKHEFTAQFHRPLFAHADRVSRRKFLQGAAALTATFVLDVALSPMALAQATSIYVAESGSDTAAGTIGDPIQTPDELESRINDADTGFLNRGDVWTDTEYGANIRLLLPDASTEGNRITIDAYGTGALPELDGEWTNYGNNASIVSLGDFCTVQNIKISNAGPEFSGTNSGMRSIQADTQQDAKIIGVECDGAWRGGIHIQSGTGSINEVTSCDVQNTSRSEQSAFNWAVQISIRRCRDAGFAVTIDGCFVHQIYGEGAGMGAGSHDCTIQNHEGFACKQVGIYNDAGNSWIVRRAFVYGTTTTAFHRDVTNGYSGHAFASNCESFNNTTDAENYDDVQMYFCMSAFCDSGLFLADQHASAETQNMICEHMTHVDNDLTFLVNANTWVGSNNFVRNNASFPISAGTEHVGSFNAPSGIWDWTYWYTALDAAPTNNASGSNDRENTTPVLERMTGWQSGNTDQWLNAGDWNPTTRVQSTELTSPNEYDADYYNTSGITMDEFGAILFDAASPDPPGPPPSGAPPAFLPIILARTIH